MSIGERLRAFFRRDEPAEVVRVDLGYTLMRLHPELEVHVPMETRRKAWFLEIAAVGVDLVEPALREIFARHGARFRAAEPADPNYFALVDHRHEPVAFQNRGPYPWETDASVAWEASNCWAAVGADRVVPLLPAAFTTHLLLRRLATGAIDAAEFRRLALPRFGSDEALVEKIVAAPATFLDLGLRMAAAGAGWE